MLLDHGYEERRLLQVVLIRMQLITCRFSSPFVFLYSPFFFLNSFFFMNCLRLKTNNLTRVEVDVRPCRHFQVFIIAGSTFSSTSKTRGRQGSSEYYRVRCLCVIFKGRQYE